MENRCCAHQYDQNLLKGPYAHFHLHIFLVLGLCWSSFVWFPVQDNLYLSHSGIWCSPSEHHLCRENSVLALFPLCWLFVFWLAAPLNQNVGGASDTGPKKRENRGKNCKLSETELSARRDHSYKHWPHYLKLWPCLIRSSTTGTG